MKRRLFIALPQFGRDLDAIDSLTSDFAITTADSRDSALTELMALQEPVDALLIGFRERIDEELLRGLPDLKVIGSLSTGTDHIDLAACEQHAVTVVTAGGVNAYAVAEHILMMILALRKQALTAHNACLSGEDRGGLAGRSRELRGCRVGILGGGKSARHLIDLLAPFQARIALWVRDPDRHRDLADCVGFLDLATLFQTADVVSLNLALNDETRCLITPELIQSLPTDAMVINCARLELLDRPAIAEALSQRPDIRIGIDAIGLSSSHLFPCLDDRALFSPHIAGVTAEASLAMDQHVINGIRKALEDRA